jgi:hypothetical protein
MGFVNGFFQCGKDFRILSHCGGIVAGIMAFFTERKGLFGDAPCQEQKRATLEKVALIF